MNHFRRAIVTYDVCVFAEGARNLARQVLHVADPGPAV
jgi:hypothetical protein